MRKRRAAGGSGEQEMILPTTGQDSATFADDLVGVVRAEVGDKQFHVGNEVVESYSQKILLDASKKFKTEFVNQILEYNLVQPNNGHMGELLILPDGVKFFYSGRQSAIAVVEQKPQVRTLIFDRSQNSPTHINEGDRVRRLALPYTVFVVNWAVHGGAYTFSNLFVTYRTKPLGSLTDVLCWPNLPNLGGELDHGPMLPLVCMGKFDCPAGSILEQLGAIIRHYWSSPYNDDLSKYYWDAANQFKEVSSLDAWEKATAKDSLFPLKVKWKAFKSIGDFIADILKNFQGERLPLAETNVVAGRVYNEAWEKASKLSRIMPVTSQVRAAMKSKVEEVFAEFVTELADKLGAVGNETVQRTVRVAVKSALKKAMKKTAAS
jgi:hypothetical protein